MPILPQRKEPDMAAPVLQVKEIELPRLPRRKRDAYKGDFGRLFILAGSRDYTGAPVLCANAAVRSGAGLSWL